MGFKENDESKKDIQKINEDITRIKKLMKWLMKVQQILVVNLQQI
jgi:hypothetical protein